MPRDKKHPHDWPSLNKWLYSINMSDDQIKENFCYSALVDYFPGSKNGSHIVPTNEEIKKEKKRLEKTIKSFDPEIIVTIGKLSLSNCLREEINLLKNYIGQSFYKDAYGIIGKEVLIIPLPHPSGASIWYKKKGNKNLLMSALKLLKESL